MTWTHDKAKAALADRTVYDNAMAPEVFASEVRLDDFGEWVRIVLIARKREDTSNGHLTERREVVGTVTIPASARARIARQLDAKPCVFIEEEEIGERPRLAS